MPLPKTIQVFLPDGDPQSIRIAEITSRTVQALQVPRGMLGQAASRPELRQVGVYFLFGQAEEEAAAPVYIGESEDCWARLQQHHKGKEFWTQALAVVSKTNAFDKGQARWLEWHATRTALAADRFKVLNQCAAAEPHLTEPVKADLLDQFDTLRVLVALLGYPLFRPAAALSGAVDSSASEAQSEPTFFFCTSKGGVSSRGYPTAEGFVVLAGSTARAAEAASVGESVVRQRRRLQDDGVLVSADGVLRFAKNHVFASPSGAASVVMGANTNGWTKWKTGAGQTLQNRTD
jgi:hypothetical protein